MIHYLPLKRITAMHADEIHEAVRSVVDSGWYLRGEATAAFEESYARYIGTSHCIGVANGLDALTLILRAYKELGRLRDGDEVIVPANTFIATILAITENRLTPVLVEPCIDTFQIDDTRIEAAITPRTRALMLVHLYGRCAYTPRIADICRRHHLLLIEDNAQAHGCTCEAVSPPRRIGSLAVSSVRPCEAVSPPRRTGSLAASSACPCEAVFPPRRTGSLGDAAAHSFYPGKNLGALGDGGAVTTNDETLAHTVREIANYGATRKYVFDYQGRNSRLDELQAAVLTVKLRYLDADNQRRRDIAAIYINKVKGPFVLPVDDSAAPGSNVYHIFPLLCERRDDLQRYLAAHGVETAIHYPIPPHLQKSYSAWNSLSLPITERIHREELSLPCHPAMTDDEVQTVVTLLNAYQ